MEGNRVKVEGNGANDAFSIRDRSVRGTRDINCMAAAGTHSVSVMAWNYHDLDTISPAEPVEISITDIPSEKATLYHYRVDETHSNSYTAWKQMGSPQHPTPKQIRALEKAGQLELLEKPRTVAIEGGRITLPVRLPGQAVSLIRLVWK